MSEGPACFAYKARQVPRPCNRNWPTLSTWNREGVSKIVDRICHQTKGVRGDQLESNLRVWRHCRENKRKPDIEGVAIGRLVSVECGWHTKLVRFLAHATATGPPCKLGTARISANRDSDSLSIIVSIRIILMPRTLRPGTWLVPFLVEQMQISRTVLHVRILQSPVKVGEVADRRQSQPA